MRGSGLPAMFIERKGRDLDSCDPSAARFARAQDTGMTAAWNASTHRERRRVTETFPLPSSLTSQRSGVSGIQVSAVDEGSGQRNCLP